MVGVVFPVCMRVCILFARHGMDVFVVYARACVVHVSCFVFHTYSDVSSVVVRGCRARSDVSRVVDCVCRACADPLNKDVWREFRLA